MEVSNEKLKEYTRRIMISRMRLLCNNGFYGLLLMHMRMNISAEHETAWSDLNDRLYFNPDFLEMVSDGELDYVMIHLLLHVVLKHLDRKGDFDDKCYDEAADIVVNSNILRSNENDIDSISLTNFGGVQKHLVPGGDEGWKYSVEEVYRMLKEVKRSGDSDDEEDDESDSGGEETLEDASGSGGNENGSGDSYSGWDYHNKMVAGDSADKNLNNRIWQERVMQAAAAMKRNYGNKIYGPMPLFAERFLTELQEPQTDWRTVLDEFVQEEICDYSFCPPDRRFDDSPFFLPEYNEKDESIENIWFVVDTSGSISNEAIATAYSEICAAIEQFNGKLSGMLSFTEGQVTEPIPFSSVENLMDIEPVGGGGNDFSDIFRYMANEMMDKLPTMIIIITDGYDTFPSEDNAMGIPVLWLINNDDVTPPWGKIARIKVEENRF